METKINMTFDKLVAKDVGTDAAIILSNIEFWQSKNKANKTNFHEGRYWTYNSVSAWCELFSYLTKNQIRHCLDKLKNKGYIEVGNFNKSNYDRTKWYSSNYQVDLGNITNGSGKINEPIPYINTYNKQQIINTNNNYTENSKKFSVEDLEVEFEEINNKTIVLNSENEKRKKVPQKKEIIVYSEEVQNCLSKCLTFFEPHLHPKNKDSWLKTIENLNRIDGVPFSQIENITQWARNDNFWSGNFLSLTKLRTKNKEKLMYIVVFNEKMKNGKQAGSNSSERHIIRMQNANSNVDAFFGDAK